MHLAESYPPDYGGGAAIYLQDVCRFLTERGHEVRVLCAESADRPPYTIRTDADGSVRVYRINLPYFRDHDPGGWGLSIREWQLHQKRTLGALTTCNDEWTPDLVNFHTPYSLLEECLPLIEAKRLPVVGLLHDAWVICPRLNLIRSPTGNSCTGPGPGRCLECLYSHWDGSHAKAAVKLPWRALKLGFYPAYKLLKRREARQYVRGLIAVSRFIAEVHEGFIPGPVRHISLGVDLTGLPETRPVRPRAPLRFGFAAGFQTHKGIWDILDAAALLKREGLEFELHIWGPGQQREPIEQRDLGDRVFLRGSFSRQDKWQAFAEMDVLVMATRVAEAHGRVVQEAAAMGAPTLAPAVGGITEQIRDGVDGLLYRFLDVDDLSRQMARLIRNPSLVGELSANLRPVVDTRTAVGEIEKFYFEVLGQGAQVADVAEVNAARG